MMSKSVLLLLLHLHTTPASSDTFICRHFVLRLAMYEDEPDPFVYARAHPIIFK